MYWEKYRKERENVYKRKHREKINPPPQTSLNSSERQGLLHHLVASRGAKATAIEFSSKMYLGS